MQVMAFIQKSPRRYDGLRRKMDFFSKGRDEYPTTVTSVYNLILECQPEPVSMQGVTVQYDNHPAFVQHNEQGEGKRTAKIYKNVT